MSKLFKVTLIVSAISFALIAPIANANAQDQDAGQAASDQISNPNSDVNQAAARAEQQREQAQMEQYQRDAGTRDSDPVHVGGVGVGGNVVPGGAVGHVTIQPNDQPNNQPPH